MQARKCLIALAAILVAAPLAAQNSRFGFGKPITEAEISSWNIDVRPDGEGLPAGKGSVAEGEKIFSEQCSACHGENAKDPAHGFDRLSGGAGSLTTSKPVQTIGSYWPYATTVFDYVNRAMPFTAPQTLTHDQVYAVVAYLLFVNNIVPRETVLDAASLAKVKMPNADGFIPDGRPDTDDSRCKTDCK